MYKYLTFIEPVTPSVTCRELELLTDSEEVAKKLIDNWCKLTKIGERSVYYMITDEKPLNIEVIGESIILTSDLEVATDLISQVYSNKMTLAEGLKNLSNLKELSQDEFDLVMDTDLLSIIQSSHDLAERFKLRLKLR